VALALFSSLVKRLARHALACFAVVFFVSVTSRDVVRAQEPWHLAGWNARALVDVKPTGDSGADTAVAKILCQARARPDGADYRVLNASGQLVPFQILFHDAARYSMIAFRAEDPKGRYLIYFGKESAGRSEVELRAVPTPGAGAPKAATWVPQHGFVFQTLRRPEGPNPKTAEDMARLIAASPAPDGARLQRGIADGFNPFGPSDNYISIYRGWIRIPTAGTYQFCTVSNEASFSFLDGKPLVHWPGRHTVERGQRGEVHAAVELTAGLHYLEYYHEEVALQQMAYLGWRCSADEGPFEPIPESVFTAPHTAEVVRLESPGTPLLSFEPVLIDSVWPTSRHEGQYTRSRMLLSPGSRLPADAPLSWDFGDGQTGSGRQVEHVYLATGSYQVTLSSGALKAVWPLNVFEIEHVTDQFKESTPAEYARRVKTYNRDALDAASLRELAHVLSEADEPAAAVETGQIYLKRFAAESPREAARMQRLVADCAIRLGQGGLEEAIAGYEASITKQTPAPEALDVLARLVRLLGVEKGLPERVAEVEARAEQVVRSSSVDETTRDAYRRVLIASGDVRLWAGKPGDAQAFYKRAEALSGRFVPSQVRAARLGAFPNAIREFLESKDYGAALDVVERWEETFPTDKVHGHSFFWRGRLLHLRDQPRDAARYLARAIGLAPGAAFETEARWRLADALEKLGRHDEARKELAKLATSGMNDEYTRRAKLSLERKEK
jgi:TolA-binding protein